MKKRRSAYLQRQLKAGLAKKNICRCCNGEGYVIVDMSHFEKRKILRERRAEKDHWKNALEEE
tara:strand:+ start:6295 stop:6483 length:189 start_codon:yes stop_codon:yes gene_type:complete